MPFCAAYNCTNRAPAEGISFHSFPRDEKIRNKWLRLIRPDSFEPTKNSKVCSAHFEEDYFEPSYALNVSFDLNKEPQLGSPIRRRLKPWACPTIFNFMEKATPVGGSIEKRRRLEVNHPCCLHPENGLHWTPNEKLKDIIARQQQMKQVEAAENVLSTSDIETIDTVQCTPQDAHESVMSVKEKFHFQYSDQTKLHTDIPADLPDVPLTKEEDTMVMMVTQCSEVDLPSTHVPIKQEPIEDVYISGHSECVDYQGSYAEQSRVVTPESWIAKEEISSSTSIPARPEVKTEDDERTLARPEVKTEDAQPTPIIPEVETEDMQPTSAIPDVKTEDMQPISAITEVKTEDMQPTYAIPEVKPEDMQPTSAIPEVETEDMQPTSAIPEVKTEDFEGEHGSDTAWQIYKDGEPFGHVVDPSYHQDSQQSNWNTKTNGGSQHSSVIVQLQQAVSTQTSLTISASTGDKRFSCSECSTCFKRLQGLSRHMRIHSEERPYKCSECPSCFKEPGSLKTHIRTHTGERPFKCSFCEYSGVNHSALNRHMRTHTGEKPYKCSVCEFRSADLGSLNGHKRTHTGEKPFKCPLCEYRCSTRNYLNIHVRTHTEEKRFGCTMCEYKCVRSHNLVRHMRIHTGEKPYKCPLCDFRCASELSRHMLTHAGEKPIKCTVCEFSCTRQGQMTAHMSTHTGEKPFKCTECPSSYKHAGSLKAHMRDHKGGKPFQCSLCKYSCASQSHLTKHKMIHT